MTAVRFAVASTCSVRGLLVGVEEVGGECFSYVAVYFLDGGGVQVLVHILW